MKLSAKQSALIKSYWHAFIAVETAFVIEYVKSYVSLTGAHAGWPAFNFTTFAYSAIGATAAPATRALVEKWPWLSPLQVRLTTKLAQLEKAAPAAPATPENNPIK
jgi:hypothetical protein